jgi:hypothetical protein
VAVALTRLWLKLPWVVLGLIPIALMLDQSPAGQLVADVVVWAVTLLILSNAPPRLRRVMLVCVPISLAGELLLTWGLGFYDYRRHAVPGYVPAGHALVYGAIFVLARQRFMRRAAPRTIAAVWMGTLLLALTRLIGWHDTVGFVLFLAWSLVLLVAPRRAFLLAMFFLTTYLEFLGTSFHCWAWAPMAGPGLSAANPPIGAPVFYICLDLLCDATVRMLPHYRTKVTISQYNVNAMTTHAGAPRVTMEA